jgi:hypothetical protein
MMLSLDCALLPRGLEGSAATARRKRVESRSVRGDPAPTGSGWRERRGERAGRFEARGTRSLRGTCGLALQCSRRQGSSRRRIPISARWRRSRARPARRAGAPRAENLRAAKPRAESREARQARGGLNGVSAGGPPGANPSTQAYPRAATGGLHQFGTPPGTTSLPEESSTAEGSSEPSSGASQSRAPSSGTSGKAGGKDAACETAEAAEEAASVLQLPA